VKQIAASIEQFGFTNPVLVSDAGEIIAGHGRVEAAKLLGVAKVPTLALSHLSETERRAYVLADNKLALNAGWDKEILAIELQALVDLEFDVELTGFSLAEVDFALDDAREADPSGPDAAEDAVPTIEGPAVSRLGDLWQLGRHRLLCGDTRSTTDMDALMGEERADLLFTDPPYNVAIDGHVCGLGSVKHREFAFASGEMSASQFTVFLTETLSNLGRVMRDGAIAFVCMDWRHMRELLEAGEAAFTELKNLVVWNKTNGGMGAFYRSKHELIFVFKVGTAPHNAPIRIAVFHRHAIGKQAVDAAVFLDQRTGFARQQPADRFRSRRFGKRGVEIGHSIFEAWQQDDVGKGLPFGRHAVRCNGIGPRNSSSSGED
jgi:hypothetical protein